MFKETPSLPPRGEEFFPTEREEIVPTERIMNGITYIAFYKNNLTHSK